MVELFTLFCFFCLVLSVLGLLLHSCSFFYLAAVSTNGRGACPEPGSGLPEQLPLQVIQLPVYNEDPAMVMELIDSACGVAYPVERLVVQLLDDSDLPEISSALREYVAQILSDRPELQLFYLHRKERKGYKAGNLNFGLASLASTPALASGLDPQQTIVSIFDADHLVPEDYLQRIVPWFTRPEVAVVQGATIFRNSGESVLTRAEAAFQQNLHRTELSRRAQAGHLSMFRGSAGSLRLSVVEEAGYWQGDTQIEDVDLSFDVQCRGWKVVYDDCIVSPSLLPERYLEYKLQQRSWMKGLMEVMRKRLGQVIASDRLRFSQKLLVADFFLVLSLQALFMVTAHVSFIPGYYFWSSIASPIYINVLLVVLLLFFLVSHIPFFVFQQEAVSTSDFSAGERGGKRLLQPLYSFCLMTAMFPAFTYGLVEGLFGVAVHRERTGKGGGDHQQGNGQGIAGDSMGVLRKMNIFEIILAVYSVGMVCWAWWQGEYLLFFVYSVLAVIYPVNAVVSFIQLNKHVGAR